MFAVILRSVCVGFGALAIAAFLGVFVVLPVTLYFLTKHLAPSGDGEVGWDLVSMAHNQPGAAVLLAFAAVLVFAVGSYVGFRHFSESRVGR
jgi:hypothetical protein